MCVCPWVEWSDCIVYRWCSYLVWCGGLVRAWAVGRRLAGWLCGSFTNGALFSLAWRGNVSVVWRRVRCCHPPELATLYTRLSLPALMVRFINRRCKMAGWRDVSLLAVTRRYCQIGRNWQRGPRRHAAAWFPAKTVFPFFICYRLRRYEPPLLSLNRPFTLHIVNSRSNSHA